MSAEAPSSPEASAAPTDHPESAATPAPTHPAATVATPGPRPPVAEALQAARAHQQAGRLQKAEAIYRQILSADPREPQALRGLGIIAHRARRADAAVDLLKKSLAVDPSNADTHNDLGGILGGMGRTQEAVAEFRRALDL